MRIIIFISDVVTLAVANVIGAVAWQLWRLYLRMTGERGPNLPNAYDQ